MTPVWTRETLLDASGAFMTNCVLGTAAELGIFDLLDQASLTAEEVASRIGGSLRGTRILLDALAALGLVSKEGERYALPATLRGLLTSTGAETVLPMLLHRMNVARSWTMLAWTVKAGFPAPRPASIRGPHADYEAFAAAMHVVSQPVAEKLVRQLCPLSFRRLLDLGGATGTWTLAFLQAVPDSEAILLDLPIVIEQARQRLAQEVLGSRIRLVAANYLQDPLPGPVDFCWVSAICHQHSREENRRIFRKLLEVTEPGGRIAIRDIVLREDRIWPIQGALFAVNMLANTTGGNCYTFREYAEDLEAAGWQEPEWVVKTEDMNCVIVARRP
ncbi:MAG: acetylserotonin O-methyltransferase [Thermoguttaceae bacterium]|nr:acetylserotonin O-methyltransferase [Thermoguttaceae bacterium]MDW8078123.1 methyltransferase [Thermoguttaceae bacterium]